MSKGYFTEQHLFPPLELFQGNGLFSRTSFKQEFGQLGQIDPVSLITVMAKSLFNLLLCDGPHLAKNFVVLSDTHFSVV